MRVVNIHGENDVRLDPVAAPAPGSKDVVIQVKACGICGSDLTYIKLGGIRRRPGGVTPIGHEAAGEVISVGSDVKGVSTINARAESIMKTGMWRVPFQRRRCLVPADGFYEWKKLDPKTKQPMYVTRRDGGLFAFAGL